MARLGGLLGSTTTTRIGFLPFYNLGLGLTQLQELAHETRVTPYLYTLFLLICTILVYH